MKQQRFKLAVALEVADRGGGEDVIAGNTAGGGGVDDATAGGGAVGGEGVGGEGGLATVVEKAGPYILSMAS